jgi:hypothetical protein
MADNDDKTPVGEAIDKPEDVKPVSAAPAPVNPDPEPPKRDLGDLVDNLANKVDELENMVKSLVETDGERDSVPGGGTPWTHRRFL